MTVKLSIIQTMRLNDLMALPCCQAWLRQSSFQVSKDSQVMLAHSADSSAFCQHTVTILCVSTLLAHYADADALSADSLLLADCWLC